LGRFKLRWGDNEIEYEGEDSTKKYEEALTLFKITDTRSQLPPEGDSEKEVKKERGPPRKGIFAPEIVKLVEEKYFKLPHKRSLQNVQKALQERGIPVSGKSSQILMALKRQLRTKLKGTKTPDGWTFWQE